MVKPYLNFYEDNQTIENDEKNKDKQPEISNCFPNSFYNK